METLSREKPGPVNNVKCAAEKLTFRPREVSSARSIRPLKAAALMKGASAPRSSTRAMKPRAGRHHGRKRDCSRCVISALSRHHFGGLEGQQKIVCPQYRR